MSPAAQVPHPLPTDTLLMDILATAHIVAELDDAGAAAAPHPVRRRAPAAPGWLARLRGAWARLRLAPALGIFLALLAIACGDPSTVPPEPGAVATVVVTPDRRSLVVGEAATLTASPRDALGRPVPGATVRWKSSDAAVATVAGDGRVTAVGIGTATISATSAGKAGRAEVIVTTGPVVGVEVAPRTMVLAPGEAYRFAAMPRDAGGRPVEGRAVTWRTSDASVAVVSATGHVTAVAPGSATIVATAAGIDGTAALTVRATVPVRVDRVEVTPTAVVLEPGATRQLTAVVRDVMGNVLTGRTVTWTTDAPAVAAVSAAGLVTGVGHGYATIVATSEGKTFGVAVTVTPAPVASIDVTPSPGAVPVGQTLPLRAQPRDARGGALDRPVTWTSADPLVATVDAAGRVTGHRASVARITATSEGVSRTVDVWVYTVTQYRLTAAGGGALPRTLFTTTETGADGVVRTTRWEATEGYLRLTGAGGWEQAILFWIHREGSPATQVVYAWQGSFEYDVTTPGGLIFYVPGTGTSFTGRLAPDGTLTVMRRLQPGTPELAFVHAPTP